MFQFLWGPEEGFEQAKSSHRPKAALGFPQLIRSAVENSYFSWKSRLLKNEPIRTSRDPQALIVKIVNEVAAGTAVRRQTRSFLKGRDLRNLFYQVSDRILPFCPSYQEFLESLKERVGDSFVEYHAGSANPSLYLTLLGKQAHVVEEDSILKMLYQTKMRDLSFRESESKVDTVILSALQPDEVSAQLPERLKMARKNLLLISFTSKCRNREKLKRWIVDLANEAISAGAPMTGFDLALFTALLLKPGATWAMTVNEKRLSQKISRRSKHLDGFLQVIELNSK